MCAPTFLSPPPGLWRTTFFFLSPIVTKGDLQIKRATQLSSSDVAFRKNNLRIATSSCHDITYRYFVMSRYHVSLLRHVPISRIATSSCHDITYRYFVMSQYQVSLLHHVTISRIATSSCHHRTVLKYYPRLDQRVIRVLGEIIDD